MGKQRFFNDVPLAENLYPDSRKREGHWRYKWPSGSFQNFEAATVQEANAFALEANQVRDQRPLDESPANALPYWAEKYIAHREAIDPGLINKSSWSRRNRSCIRQFAKQFQGMPVFHISLKHIRPWWDSLSGNSQRNKKPELNRFCNHLIAEEVTPNLQPHPFNVLMMRPVETKKRVRMTIEAYWTIYNQAGELGLDHVQNAMALALLTFMRRADLCSLRFDEHTNSTSLWKVINKAAAQGKPKKLIWNFEHWPELRKVVARCRESSMRNQRCPYLLSKKYERICESEFKDHPHQLLPDMLTEDFSKARDATGLYLDLPSGQRPELHEIRSTGSFLYKEQEDQTSVMQAMAHSDIEMTKHYQSGHKVEEFEIGLSELPNSALGGAF